jgi:hypothetical protein
MVYSRGTLRFSLNWSLTLIEGLKQYIKALVDNQENRGPGMPVEIGRRAEYVRSM